MNANGSMRADIEQGGVEVVERLAPEWRALCDEDANDDPRYRPEWVTAYLSAFTPKAKILVITARADGQLKAILPLIWEKDSFSGLPVTKLSTLPKITATRFDLVQTKGPDRAAACAAVWERLKSVPGWQMLELGGAFADSPLCDLFVRAHADGYKTAILPMLPSPYLTLPAYDPKKPFTVEPRSQGQRTKLRKVNRELETPTGRLRLVRFDEADRDALQRFYELEASGWKGKQGSAILSLPTTRQFYQQLTDAASRLGYFTLYELYLDGQHVAGTLGFTYRGRFFTPKGAHHEGFREHAVGHLIIQHVIQDCVKRGLRAFEFLGVPDDWKKLWTSDVREHPTCCVFQRSIASYLLHAVQFRIKPAARSFAAGSRSDPTSA